MTVRIWSHFVDGVWEGDVPSHYFSDVTNKLDMCEIVFRLFNCVDEEDVARLDLWGYTLPSLSVDDRVTIDGQTWQVAGLGFTEVTA